MNATRIRKQMQALHDEYAKVRFREKVDFGEVFCADTPERTYRVPPRDLALRPIHSGDHWGKSGITTWFFVEAAQVGEGMFLSFDYASADTYRAEQVLAFVNDVPCGVLDRYHSHVPLPCAERVRIALEAYPSHTVPGNQPHERGRIVGCDTRTFFCVKLSEQRDLVKRFLLDLAALLSLYGHLPEHDAFRLRIDEAFLALYGCVDAFPPENEEALNTQMQAALEILAPLMAARNGTFAPRAALVGHAHIDTAWQWDLTETTRKCARTFSSVLNLMRQYPEFTFVQSQPYQLERMREYPELYEEILQRIGEGRWELNGGMYIEPDLNMPSGEALVRQLYYGQQAIKELSGRISDTLWMPDTFGFSAALPQIMLGAGVRFFSTGKLAGNDTTPFPYHAFRWRGIDGSEVVGHMMRISDGVSPDVLIQQWNDARQKSASSEILRAYGYGDGGGGPTADMLEEAHRAADWQSVPRAYHTSVSDFMQRIDADDLPVYEGELYFQAHRGTYTSISELKWWNRRVETEFQQAEYLLARALLEGESYPRNELDALWKRFLVCQFHDILPGTAIQEVNEQALDTLKDVSRALHRYIDAPLDGQEMQLLNTTGLERAGGISFSLPKGLYPKRAGMDVQMYHDMEGAQNAAIQGIVIPAASGVGISLSHQPPEPMPSAFVYDGNTLSTPQLRARFDEQGCIVSLIPNGCGEMIKTHFNTFWLGEDVPSAWDNWDIDEEQASKMRQDFRLLSRAVVSDGPVQLRIRSEYALGNHSRMTQDMVFYADTQRIDFDTRLEWHEKRTLFKVGFGSVLRAKYARHETQFGNIVRPVHRNEAQDRAMFEVCAHRWSDLSQADKGITLLNDGKYGISVHAGDLRLTLIKSSVHPDTRGDDGVHRFRYALLPHAGCFSAARALPDAYALNAPVLLRCGTGDSAPLVWTDNPSVVIESVKGAQEEDAIVLRLYETEGGQADVTIHASFPVVRAFETNLLEEPLREMDTGCLTCVFHPFEIKTVLLMPAGKDCI